MKLEKRYQIEKAVSNNQTRFSQTYVHIDKESSSLVATTGYILAKVPVQFDESDETGSGAIHPKPLVAARKKAGRLFSLTLGLNGTFQHADGSTEPRPTADDAGHFPQWQAIVPKAPKIKHTVSVNPEFLLDLAKAIGWERGDGITLEFQEDKDSAVIVKCGAGYGLIMPMRV